jgi:hypothetical protein
MTLVVCCWWKQGTRKATRNQRGRDESDHFCGDFGGFAGKKTRFEQFRLELDVKLAVCEPIVSTAKRHRGRGFRQLSAGRRIFWAVGWWRTGDGERWPVCGRFDVKAGQVVSSVLAR